MLFLQLQNVDIDKLSAADSTARASLEDKIDKLTHMPVEDALASIMESLVHLGMKLLAAALIYIAGRWVIKRARLLMNKIFERRHVDISLRTFLGSLTSMTLNILLIMAVIGTLGINTSFFLALIASAGLAIGMALSGTLQNFAGGVMILLLKPYRIGDYISAQGYEGTVKEIALFSTVINTPDNKTIYMPNGGMSTSIVNNYSHESIRRAEWIIKLSYGDDYDKAKAEIVDILDNDRRALKTPPYQIVLNALGESSVSIAVWVWTYASVLNDLQFDVNAKIYKILPQKGFRFAYPQLEVHQAETQVMGACQSGGNCLQPGTGDGSDTDTHTDQSYSSDNSLNSVSGIQLPLDATGDGIGDDQQVNVQPGINNDGGSTPVPEASAVNNFTNPLTAAFNLTPTSGGGPGEGNTGTGGGAK